MSRIGKKIIEVPAKVKLTVSPEGEVVAEGPKGKLGFQLSRGITARLDGNHFIVERANEERQTRAMHGTSRARISNNIEGVTNGFVKDLEITGVGFKANVQGSILNLALGFSHPIVFPIPAGIKITVTDNTKIKVEGIDRQVVGQVAANIRGYYPPEPYKGKGVKYAGEKINRKEGKTVQ